MSDERPVAPIPRDATADARSSQRLAGRRILVVGAGTRPSDDPDAPDGNGRAISVLAAREGAAVACADLDPDAAADTLARVHAEGAAGVAIAADAADPDTCRAMVADAVQGLGGLDGVVVNVGIGAGRGLAGTSAEQWDAVFAVNVRAHFLVAQAAIPHLPAGASIVLISSVAGLRPGSGIPAYDTSKAATFGLARHLALEGARTGVRANVVVPGLIDTPLGRLATAGRPSRGRTPVPLGRQGTAWEVAQATVFLLSDQSSYMTGQSLVVDGGLSLL